MLRLGGYRRDVPFAHSGLILGSWPCRRSTIAAVKAGAPRSRIVDYGCVVHIMDIGDVHIVDGTVVEEASIVPAAPSVAVAEISIAVINPAVETDLGSPVALMEDKPSTFPTPPARRPQIADCRSQHPSARHPVVVAKVVIVSPISGSPDVTVARTQRLRINR